MTEFLRILYPSLEVHPSLIEDRLFSVLARFGAQSQHLPGLGRGRDWPVEFMCDAHGSLN